MQFRKDFILYKIFNKYSSTWGYAKGHDLRKMACWLAFWSGMNMKYIRERGFWKTNAAILKCYLVNSVPLDMRL